MTTSVFVATSTSTIYDITAQTSTVDGAVIASATTLGVVSVELIEYTTTQVFPVSSTSDTVVVSTAGSASSVQDASLTTLPKSVEPSESDPVVATTPSPQPSTSSNPPGEHPDIIGESSSGLSTSAKAGIGAGAPVGIVAFVALFLLYLGWSKKRRTRAAQYSHDYDGAYNPTSDSSPEEVNHPVLPETQRPEVQVHPAYENPNPRLSHPSHMSGTTYQSPQDDEPLYLGIPAHMSGDKRWSKEKG